jgi:hypothetical protein
MFPAEEARSGSSRALGNFRAAWVSLLLRKSFAGHFLAGVTTNCMWRQRLRADLHSW